MASSWAKFFAPPPPLGFRALLRPTARRMFDAMAQSIDLSLDRWIRADGATLRTPKLLLLLLPLPPL